MSTTPKTPHEDGELDLNALDAAAGGQSFVRPNPDASFLPQYPAPDWSNSADQAVQPAPQPVPQPAPQPGPYAQPDQVTYVQQQPTPDQTGYAPAPQPQPVYVQPPPVVYVQEPATADGHHHHHHHDIAGKVADIAGAVSAIANAAEAISGRRN